MAAEIFLNPMATAAAKMLRFLEDEAPGNSSGRACSLRILWRIVWWYSEVLVGWELIPSKTIASFKNNFNRHYNAKDFKLE